VALLRPSQLAGGRPIYVLTLVWVGREWRWSSEPIDVTSAPIGSATTTVRADGGLDNLEIERHLEAVTSAPDLRSVALSLVWPVDVAALIAQGHDLASATGELALLTPTMTWEERLVLLLGQVSQPEYAGAGEPVSLSLVEDPQDDTAQVPSPPQRVTTDTWPSAQASALGRYYPIPFGTPGVYYDRDGTRRLVRGSPALCVNYDTATGVGSLLLIGIGYQAAYYVKLRYQDPSDPPGVDSTSIALAIAYQLDGMGQLCAVVDISAYPTGLGEAGEWWAIWSEGGSLKSPFARPGPAGAGEGAMSGAGEMLAWAALRSSLKLDVGRFLAIAEELRWPVSGYIDEGVHPWEWAADNLLPLLPVSIAVGPLGQYPVLWRHDARRSDAVFTLREGDGYVRSSPVTYARKPKEILNEVRLKWANDGDGHRQETVGTPQLSRSPASSGTELAAVRQGTTYSAERSLARYGVVRTESIESDIVYDAVTAWRCVAWRLRRGALSARQVELEAGPECYRLSEGDVVIYVDEELGLDVLAQVATIALTDSATGRVILEILDPALTSTPTPGPYVTDIPPAYGPGQ
jgi:hypothetical protein